ncbi:RidA family protein [uncultured Aquitalea sp.]|uniref:RidA family protein n=1 Tax=uncultured Aquitalea sp. TaxID=540272 RepID=UPI0025F041F3|nr:RidA family protein [uncultured Aquitalea sp.]
MSRDEKLRLAAQSLGFDIEAEIRIGGHYLPVLRDGDWLFVSGQVPRIGEMVVATGAAGAEASIEQARRGAAISAVRCLALLRKELGTLEQLARIVRLTVFVRSADGFGQQSEVADAASDLLVAVLGEAGLHARTSVGVAQLPKGATVEIELQAKAA